MTWTFLLALLVFEGKIDGEDAIIEMIKDAQATNAARVQAGTMQFRVAHSIKGKRAIRASGSFSWRGEDGLWAYRFTDPDHILTARESEQKELEASPVEYMLLENNKIYSHASVTNVLHLSQIKERQQFSTTFHMFDLFPAILWGRCCPPHHSDGRPWAEMFGAHSPAAQPDSTHELTRMSPDLFRYLRNDPGKGTLSIDLSMQYSGQVTSCRYDVSSKKGRSSLVTYTWEKTSRGAVVLKSCEARKSAAGDPDDVVETFRLELDDVRVDDPVPRSKFLFAEFQKLLPRNTIVNDNIANRMYPLHKSSGPADDRLKELSKEARSRGFIKEGTQP